MTNEEKTKKIEEDLKDQDLFKVKSVEDINHKPHPYRVSDNVCFLQLLRNGTNEEAQNILKTLVDTLGLSFIDGFTFVETPEKYRIS